jgi:hypothetical protein
VGALVILASCIVPSVDDVLARRRVESDYLPDARLAWESSKTNAGTGKSRNLEIVYIYIIPRGYYVVHGVHTVMSYRLP